MFFTYVLISKKDGRYYVGFTSDLDARIKLHNKGDVASTKDRRPLEIVYYEACLDKDKAVKREKIF